MGRNEARLEFGAFHIYIFRLSTSILHPVLVGEGRGGIAMGYGRWGGRR